MLVTSHVPTVYLKHITFCELTTLMRLQIVERRIIRRSPVPGYFHSVPFRYTYMTVVIHEKCGRV
jgi:hypothetical protein